MSDMRASTYRKIDRMPYVRREYIPGFPPPRITKFTMGNPNGEYDVRVSLVALKDCQVRHNALEAARIAANRYLSKKLGKNYLFRILPYPHHVLREHKLLGMAQADRFQKGMKKPFGKPFGTAARVSRNQVLAVVDVKRQDLEVAKEALRRASHKFPIPCRIVAEEIEAD